MSNERLRLKLSKEKRRFMAIPINIVCLTFTTIFTKDAL